MTQAELPLSGGGRQAMGAAPDAGARDAPGTQAGAPEPGWLGELRSRAHARFLQMPWPSPLEEEWRRTDVARFGVAAFPTAACLEGGALTQSQPAGGADPVLRHGASGAIVLRGGALESLTVSEELAAKGVKLLTLGEALEQFENPLRRLFEGAVSQADNRFIPWHFKSLSHGALLYVPQFLEVKDPFFIDLEEEGASTVSFPHVVVILADGARATVVQRTAGGNGPFLCNAWLDLELGNAASLGFYDAQALGEKALYFRHTAAEVGRDASLSHFDAALGSRLVKTRIDCSLSGSGAEAFLNGAYFCHDSRHMDIRTVQHHRAGSTTSRAYYKGAVKDTGKTVFQGLIEVSPGASKTDAFLTNRNLILNDGARSDSIPSLKIGNNDVKCSHGSTTGRIDEEHLFYLMSRGLSDAEAREMLVIGYFEDIMGAAPQPFREEVLETVSRRLAGL